MPADPRSTRRYQTARRQFLARTDPVCHWCGITTSDNYPRSHPRKSTVDHLIEVDKATDLALDETLWVVACLSCNSSRGAKYQQQRNTPRTPSRNW